MESLGSYIRSAARATFSAYRRLPVRWRLGGGSAALTLVKDGDHRLSRPQDLALLRRTLAPFLGQDGA